MYTKGTQLDCKTTALNMLTRRDHSQVELGYKLKAKGFVEHEIAQACEYCLGLGYLDDERYTRAQVRHHANKGRGVLRIKQELKLKGVSETLVTRALEECDIDWFELAATCAGKKGANTDLKDIKQKSRLVRHLQQRGFDFEQINYALDTLQQ